MNRVFPGRTFFMSAYILLAVAFLTIHFTRVENYSSVVGEIVVKGRSSIGTVLSPPQVRRLRISTHGLELFFRKGDKTVLVTDDGIRHSLDVIGWTTDESSITVNFESETGITLISDPHGKGLSLIPIIPTTEPPVRSLELPFRPESGTVIRVAENRPGNLSIESNDANYAVTLPSDSSWNAEDGRLALVVLDKADPILAVTEDQSSGGLDALGWFDQGNVPSESSFNETVESWIAFARKGWESRIDSRSGLWLNADGKAEWNNEKAAAVLADAVLTGNLPAQLQNILSAAEGSPGDIGWLPSPFLGNIVTQSNVLSAETWNGSQEIIAGINGQNPDLSASEVLASLIDSGYPEQASKMTGLSRQAPAPDTPNREIVNRITLLQEARQLGIDDPVADPDIRKGYFEGYIIPRIFWAKDGLWLIEEDGSVNTNLNLQAGALLLKEAQWSNDGMYQAIGRQMIVSVLSFADDKGAIPGRILFEGGGEVVTEDEVSSEVIYKAIAKAPAYPRRVSLSKELGAGSWALTSAERFTLRSSPRETTINLDFPAGSIHHIAVKGIKEFKVMYMNGIRWNGDPNFQRYYAGWYYDTAKETLYIKIRHRAKQETIRILYYDPEAEAAETPAETGTEAEDGA